MLGISHLVVIVIEIEHRGASGNTRRSLCLREALDQQDCTVEGSGQFRVRALKITVVKAGSREISPVKVHVREVAVLEDGPAQGFPVQVGMAPVLAVQVLA